MVLARMRIDFIVPRIVEITSVFLGILKFVTTYTSPWTGNEVTDIILQPNWVSLYVYH